jgi:tetratricopeptide (TPR) repeat protein
LQLIPETKPPTPGQLQAPAPDRALEQSKSLLEAAQVTAAEGMLRKYLQANPQSADAHFLLGYALFRQARARESLAELTEGAKYRRPSATDLRVVAADYVLLRDYSAADKWFTKSLEWEPGNVLGWYYLGRTKYNENRFEEALGAFQQCLKLDPKNVKAEDNLGLSFQGLGRYEEAAAAYRNAIAWQAGLLLENAGPYVNLGSLLIEQKSSGEEAVRLLEHAEKVAPTDVKAHQQLGKAYFSLDQLPKAQTELETAVQLAPNNSPVHYMLAQVYRRQGLLDKAKVQFDICTQLNARHSAPDTPEQFLIPVK